MRWIVVCSIGLLGCRPLPAPEVGDPDSLPWRVCLDDALIDQFGEDAVRGGLDGWEAVAPVDLFDVTGPCGDDGAPFRIAAGSLAEGPIDNRIERGRATITLDPSSGGFRVVDEGTCTGGADVATSIGHEVGHWLGLDDSCTPDTVCADRPRLESIMYWTRPACEVSTPNDFDRDTLAGRWGFEEEG